MSHQLLLITISIALLIPSLFSLFKKQRTKLPPGPNKLPIIGNLHKPHKLGVGKSPHRSFHHLSNEHGPLMSLQIGFKISYNSSNVSFAPYGEYWREVRKIVALELLRTKRVQSFKAIRDEDVTCMVNFIANHCSNNPPVNLSALALALSNNVVCRSAFGKSEFGKSKFFEILSETQELLGGVNIADYFPRMEWLNKFNGIKSRLEKNFRELDSFLNQVLKEHRDRERFKAEHEDLVDVLLRIQEDPNESTITLSNDENIKGVLVDMLIAGSDTSAATLVWTMAEVMRNPMVKKKAQEEVRHVMKGKSKVEETDLSKLKYLKALIKESLRLNPPAPLLLPR
ncbi:hypothetical protein ACH5RR_025400 [Cinchona calisaya]|uniref:Cytochrome P450 n=1 Tax=Cinchona calisaya TaxID=153742 RepID=A0ABD2YZI1_9GENT